VKREVELQGSISCRNTRNTGFSKPPQRGAKEGGESGLAGLFCLEDRLNFFNSPENVELREGE
jgi:hypothetical protein